MSTDHLDDRIRALVRDAVAAAPPAPELPTERAVVTKMPDRRGLVWAGLAVAAAVAIIAVVITSNDDHSRIVAGTSSSAVTPSTADPHAWPAGVAVIVASDRGVERITERDGAPVLTQLLDKPVTRAFELENGSLVYQVKNGAIYQRDPQGNVRVLVNITAGLDLQDADMPGSNPKRMRLVYLTPPTTPAGAYTPWMWFAPAEATSLAEAQGGWAVGHRRFSIVDQRGAVAATVDDTLQRGVAAISEDRGFPAPCATRTPLQMFGDGNGASGTLDETGHVQICGLAFNAVLDVADPMSVVDIDMRGYWLAVQRASGTSTLLNLADDTSFDVPVVSGNVSVSRADYGTVPTPPDTSVTTSAPSVTDVPTTTASGPADVTPIQVVTAGPDGVWETNPNGATQWTAEPMEFAVKLPDGSMVMQRKVGLGESSGWTQDDTKPLLQAKPGAPLQDLFTMGDGSAVFSGGWYRVHDAGVVNGRPVLVMDIQYDSKGLDTPDGLAFIYDLNAGTVQSFGPVGGWESSSSRLHLAPDGTVIGEQSSGGERGMWAYRIEGGELLLRSQLGFEQWYRDCADCPRLYTVSPDGSVVGWLEGTVLHRYELATARQSPTVDLGEVALNAVDLGLDGSGSWATVDRSDSGPRLVSLDGTGKSVPLHGFRASLPN